MSLKEIKGRIASVQSTQKITSAMRMVASAKLHRTQQMTQTFLVYINELKDILAPLTPKEELEDAFFSAPVETEDCASLSGNKVAIIPISSGSGLCGAFNSNIAKATLAAKKEYEAQGKATYLVPIGKKIAHDLKREGVEHCADFVLSAEEIGKGDAYAESRRLISHLREKISAGEIDSIEFLYHHFVSMGKQVVTREVLDLSVPKVSDTPPNGQKADYITEPSPTQLIAELHPKMLNGKVYSIMLDSVTSEHAARMLAMQTADDNAKELLQELTLLYNKSRQQAITNELIDIMGGKVAQ